MLYEVDRAVVGAMARSAIDLSTAIDILAGPDELQATAHRLALPASRRRALKDFRLLAVVRATRRRRPFE